ncbi:EamA family transporter [Paenibacillus sp. D9]|uniref:EamA family transporter n=1 Tax=Paenibacillus TaxID=44249 RepID=UPI0006767CFF|nr:DMT family transporter [Paenibacillus sp. D9]
MGRLAREGYWTSVLLVLLGASSYGLMSPLIKHVYGFGYTFSQVVVHQLAAGTAMLWIVAAAAGKRRGASLRPRLSMGQWAGLALIGTAGLAMTTVLYNQALQGLKASFAIVLLFQFTWITIALDSIWSRRLPGWGRLGCVAVILAGTVLALGIGRASWPHAAAMPLLCGLGAAVTYSLYLAGTGRFRADLNPAAASAIMVTFGFILVLALFGRGAWAGDAEPRLVLWAVMLALLGQVIPTLLFTIGIPRIGSSLAALLGAMELPVAAAAAWLIEGETLSALQLGGIAAILAGIALAQKAPAKESPASLEE